MEIVVREEELLFHKLLIWEEAKNKYEDKMRAEEEKERKII